MARKAKPPAITPVFSPANWMPLVDAVALAEGALGSSYLAEGNLIEHFRSGRLPTAIYRGGTLVLLEPTFWKSLRVVQTVHPSGVLVILVLGLADESSAPHLFVARAPLDKLYSTNPALGPASGAPAEAPDAPPRRPPGPTPRYDWRILIARELIRRAKAGEEDPTAIKMIELCEQSKLHYSPRLRSVQDLLKNLLG